ncbi:uncharacterized protein L3040_000891 [Drepanopeziza brunnea f. sp. 'multigermtubi']|uniref:SMODS and SLOG-associating 2TM effector domain-containing protein n=1 Tax=Marssonina brunnea f. sp. multigermtubi (strain MB_m1) TaxID=1072389 RepID=K1X7M7_MARBU|nr:uncharacterized protein MBM_00184 [Drepanopeziza brunnea f. sp. 'multigermtubi' MB_m1]EKD21071.1 hypothetical protein MBM_00184 [Drepanopeziza brunnea f. sp. 'multigermtubi' MB_m1]KAJ5054624.1 hypothetical protein L3040_000891 [Drepanopeziza brunnea f. sp. 'multigermtubi']
MSPPRLPSDKLDVEEVFSDSKSSVGSYSNRNSAVPDPSPSVTRLSDSDHSLVCQSIGALSVDESGRVQHPTSFLYPPKGLPNGLYKDVVRSRTISQYQYYLSSFMFTSALILQLLLGAALTGIGSTSAGTSTTITVLAAVNTVLAGVLALMHNSGLPDRYKNDWTEFDEVEMYLNELVEAGIVSSGWSRDQVIEHCFALYRRAKGTVAKNKPSAYASTSSPAAKSSTALTRQP